MMKEISPTQKKISELIEKFKKEIERKEKGEFKHWRKYYGDVCVRIFREFLLEELPPEYTVSPPYAYIEDIPVEFDLLIVDKDAKPKRYTNTYSPEKVRIGIEVKAHGVFGSRENLERVIQKIKENFDKVRNRYPTINFIYLTYEEVATTKRKNSILYLEETARLLKPYKVFCLRDSRTGKLISGEWERLVQYIDNSLQKK